MGISRQLEAPLLPAGVPGERSLLAGVACSLSFHSLVPIDYYPTPRVLTPET
jgi:hypothetical protein